MKSSCRSLRNLTQLCLATLVFSTPAFGFCFQPHPSVACDFLNSDAVFAGKVIQIHAVSDSERFTDGWYYKLQVLQLFRGSNASVIEVYTGNDSGRYPLQLGKRYLIFAYVYEKKLEIDNCGDSVPLSEAKEAIGQIEKISVPKDGIVEGQVALENERRVPADNGLPGVRIFIHGEDKTYSVTTDDRGWFRIHVPPGVYSAEAKSIPAHRIVAFDLSYDQPKSFTVRTGRCAELQFVADPVHAY
jgi:hypothetical protein